MHDIYKRKIKGFVESCNGVSEDTICKRFSNPGTAEEPVTVIPREEVRKCLDELSALPDREITFTDGKYYPKSYSAAAGCGGKEL